MTRTRLPEPRDETVATSVFLVDDHEVVRRGVRELLETQVDLAVVGEAATVAQALVRVPAVRPDVAVLDLRLPDGDGVQLCRDLRSAQPALRCLLLTSFADDEAMLGAALAGASGYVLKQVNGVDLVHAVRTVAAGGTLLDAATVDRVLHAAQAGGRSGRPSRDPLEPLTLRERRVLELISEGLTNREIGRELGLAEKTVKNYVSVVLQKLGMARRTQAAVLMAKQAGER